MAEEEKVLRAFDAARDAARENYFQENPMAHRVYNLSMALIAAGEPPENVLGALMSRTA